MRLWELKEKRLGTMAEKTLPAPAGRKEGEGVLQKKEKNDGHPVTGKQKRKGDAGTPGNAPAGPKKCRAVRKEAKNLGRKNRGSRGCEPKKKKKDLGKKGGSNFSAKKEEEG